MKRFRIVQDGTDISPYDMTDIRPTVVLYSSKYACGGEEITDLADAKDFYRNLSADEKQFVFPLYIMDHSVVHIRMTSFNDGWDSGIGGYVYADPEFRSNLSANADIELEVGEFIREVDAYISGDVWSIYDSDDDTYYGPFYGRDICDEELACMEKDYGSDATCNGATYTKEQIISILETAGIPDEKLIYLARLF